jgi:hypothetical protein
VWVWGSPTIQPVDHYWSKVCGPEPIAAGCIPQNVAGGVSDDMVGTSTPRSEWVEAVLKPSFRCKSEASVEAAFATVRTWRVGETFATSCGVPRSAPLHYSFGRRSHNPSPKQNVAGLAGVRLYGSGGDGTVPCDGEHGLGEACRWQIVRWCGWRDGLCGSVTLLLGLRSEHRGEGCLASCSRSCSSPGCVLHPLPTLSPSGGV